jgi:3'-phosphoadenosine 5'-phosphosulfate sulfotransferase (PAPS reductase)/FAD synthetase
MVTAVFCDTEWEHPITLEHEKAQVALLGCHHVVLKRKEGGFVALAKKKKRFPSTMARFCTTELKVKPFIDYLIDEVHDHVLIIQGIRNDESAARSNMPDACRYFKYYNQPFALGRTMSYRKKEVLEWTAKYDDSILRPFISNSALEVIDYIKRKGFDVNPLYYMGASRVGCMPCINARHEEVRMMANMLPDAIQRLRDAEKEVGNSFFKPKYIPKKYQTGQIRGHRVPTIDDVIAHVTNDPNQLSAFAQEPSACRSVYNICE